MEIQLEEYTVSYEIDNFDLDIISISGDNNFKDMSIKEQLYIIDMIIKKENADIEFNKEVY
jgi:hypothetical protein